jgi:predicted anti-sigma-YlaC factor YlaD
MKCAHVRSRLSDYSAGLLSPRDRALVGGHLAVCEECRLVHGQFVALDALAPGEALTADAALVQAAMVRARYEDAWQAGRLATTCGGAARYVLIAVLPGLASLVAWRALGTLSAGAAGLTGSSPLAAEACMLVGIAAIGAGATWLANRVGDLLA